MSDESNTQTESEKEKEIEDDVNDLDTRIKNAKNDFGNQFMVAFLGEKYSGKTIACALIKDALTRHYKKHTDGKWLGISTEGSKKMKQITSDLTNGKFPAETLLAEATPMTLEIISPAEGKKIKIVLRDMAGEKRKEIFEEEYSDIDKRLKEIFDIAIIDEKNYGLLSHVIFAKMYIIVIDSSKFTDDHVIRMEETDIKESIRRLWEIKERVDDTTNHKIHDSIAFLFTKFDQLPTDMKKSPKELMEELSEVTGALTRYHMGEISYFKSYVESEVIPKEEFENAIKEKQRLKNQDLIDSENKQKDLEVKKKDIIQELETANNKLATSQEKLKTEIRPTEVEADITKAENKIKNCREEIDILHEEQNVIKVQLDTTRKRITKIKEKLKTDQAIIAEGIGTSKYKPKKPLKYSLDDYLLLIDWIIEMHNKTVGFTE